MARASLGIFKSLGRTRNVARKGAFASEMALIMPFFCLLLFGTTEICLMMAGQQLLESAAFNASRLAKTGYTAAGQTQAQTVNAIMVTELQSYGALLDPTKLTMTEQDYNSFAAAGSGTGGATGFGNQQQVVVYTISYPWTILTPVMSSLVGTGGVLNLTTTIVVRNEPYG